MSRKASLPSPLTGALARRIAADGPISVAAFMTACLHDPRHGYYATRPALGEHGDFITAPLVSQMFGELIGLWAVECWMGLRQPAPFHLIEMGPGDGTLMRDALNAMTRTAPDALAAAEVWLVETSGPLRRLQDDALGAHRPKWARALDDVPAGAPLILIANELLDCLPARQFVRTEKGWAERRVGLGPGESLAFGLAPIPQALIPASLRRAPLGAVVEVSAAQEALGRAVGERIATDGGAALFIDYGRDQPETGDTLQALSSHRKVDPLETAGAADLTVHADFPAFAAAARAGGAHTSPIVTQAALLNALGIQARAAALTRANPDKADLIARQLHRLTAPDQMGALFKAVAIYTPGLDIPAP